MARQELVNGVLILRGKDQVGALYAVTSFLLGHHRKGKANQPTANIRCAWLRCLGDFGSLIVYFQTTPTHFRHFADPKVLAEFQETLNARYRVVKIPKARSKASKDDAVPEIEVDVQPALPLKFDLGMNQPRPIHRIFSVHVPSSKRGLALLTKGMHALDLEIAQHDGIHRRTGKTESYEQAFRVYGPSDDSIAVGVRQLFEDRYPGNINVRASLNIGNPRPGAYLTPGTCPDPGEVGFDKFAFLVLHCKDRPGLLSPVADFMSCFPPQESLVMGARRSIVRSCCRGLGGHAAMILSTPSSDSEVAMLDDQAHDYFTKKGILTDDYPGEYCRVFSSKLSPWEYNSHWGRLTFSCQCPDQEGVINRFASIFRRKEFAEFTNVVQLDGWAGRPNNTTATGDIIARNAWGILFEPEHVDHYSLVTAIREVGDQLGGTITFG